MARTLEAERAAFETFVIPSLEEDWLELRRPWINASSCGALFDEHHYITLGDLCTEKLAGKAPVDYRKAETYARGHRWERYIQEETADTWGLKLADPTFMVRRGPILATPDAEVMGRDDVCVEYKTAREHLSGPIKPGWRWQAQALNWCHDTERCLVAALDSSLEVQYFEVERDDNAINRLVTRAQEILDALSWGEMPEGVELSSDNVGRLWPRDTGEEREVDPAVAQWTADYVTARAAKKGWEGEMERLRDLVVARIGADSFATLDGVQVASFKASKDVDKIDWRRMIAENPELAAAYTDTVPGPRTFRPNLKGLKSLGGAADEQF